VRPVSREHLLTKLLAEVLLLRNYIVGVILVWFCEGRGPIDTPPGKSDLIV
jgi:hypothetical protein